ncbi:hypothetical protein L6164_002023 [Bauhinia variegata]|uniref:Uncharacterized protein n=1 Tax=Bauhinia variegata TaxID=167791 RepID=A0ACB9Q2D7_BAUVA|nr:hypothetical protein L6164_002023 [Bauhinia variegata]
MKTGKAMYILFVTVEDDLLQHIQDAKTPKEAWKTLTTLFMRTSNARLQQLENELMAVGQYFNKVKALCNEISKLDLENKISEKTIGRIIVHGLRLEFHSLVTVINGWATKPTQQIY